MYLPFKIHKGSACAASGFVLEASFITYSFLAHFKNGFVSALRNGVGDAEVSRDHANFILNTGHAKASDVLELIHQVRSIVHKKLGVWMECEVKHIRPSDHTIPIHKVS